MIASFAQNAEDVRLWRVLGERPSGFWVDVGAGDPLVGSVTKLFSEAGWTGINVEPGPKLAELKAHRQHDVNLGVAIAASSGKTTMWITSPDPGLSSLTEPLAAQLPEGFTAAPRIVRTARLDAVLDEHAPGRAIDFLKIDAEGAERAVLESFDLRLVRPTIVLVEAISPVDHEPTHHLWEGHLIEADYLLAAFDGLNRFYVPAEHRDLVPALEYPMSVLDRYEPYPAAVQRAAATERVREMEQTISWRITRPLRAARRLQRLLVPRRS